MIRILVLITLCLPSFALANLATCTSDNVEAGGWLPQTICATNDHLLQLLQGRHGPCVCPSVHLRRGLLSHHLVDHNWRLVAHPLVMPFVMVGRAAVTTNHANCTQCTAGKYQDIESRQEYECIPCPTGYYANGVHASRVPCFI